MANRITRLIPTARTPNTLKIHSNTPHLLQLRNYTCKTPHSNNINYFKREPLKCIKRDNFAQTFSKNWCRM